MAVPLPVCVFKISTAYADSSNTNLIFHFCTIYWSLTVNGVGHFSRMNCFLVTWTMFIPMFIRSGKAGVDTE